MAERSPTSKTPARRNGDLRWGMVRSENILLEGFLLEGTLLEGTRLESTLKEGHGGGHASPSSARPPGALLHQGPSGGTLLECLLQEALLHLPPSRGGVNVGEPGLASGEAEGSKWRGLYWAPIYI